MLKRQRFWKDFIVKSKTFMKLKKNNWGKTICISVEKYLCYTYKTYVVHKVSKHVYFSDNHESIMISHHAKITSK